MCGLAGIWGSVRDKGCVLAESCRRIRHRGPDDHGVWEDPRAGLALAHVRLAILDVSQAGHQPMVSSCGDYVLVLNGEIYNHLDLRERLRSMGRAPAWRGHSDTETLLACFAAWGVPDTLQAANGMFALALWNRRRRRLVLARDRLGEKPLFYGSVNLERQGTAANNLVFASELKALAPMPGFDPDIDRGALALLLRHNYIPAPYSIYRGIHKLPPGTWIECGQEHASGEPLPAPHAYWSARQDISGQAATHAQASKRDFDSDEHATDALESVLSEAVQAQMLSDVSLGAFLSGGIDSSTVVALMQARGGAPVRTFSIGFSDRRYDETAHAAAVARHLGTLHTQMTVTSRDALAIVPLLAGIYDEPFADASQIPMALLSRLARRDVKVALSGDGGDELFGGYTRYAHAQRWWQRRCALPPALRQPVAGMLAAASHLPGGAAWRGKAAKAGDLLRAPDQAGFYRRLVSYWDDPAIAIQGGSEPPTLFDDPMQGRFADAMMLRDTQTYLPDDILVKVDRAAMACGLETRMPMLDHRVYAFAQGSAPHHKIRQGQGKWLLRQVLYRHVPRALVDRPKQGFGVPLAAWLRGPLREWAHDLLDTSRLRRQGLFHPEPIAHKWRQHVSGQYDWSRHLWSVLMAQSWLDERYSDNATPGWAAMDRDRGRP